VRRARALLAALALSAVALPAAAQQAPDEDRAVRLDVRAMSTALVPEDGGNLTIRARAVNTGTEPLRRMRIGLRFGQPVRGRFGIATGSDTARAGLRVADRRLGEGELAGGATVDANFDVPMDRLPFRHSRLPAVYPLRIEVRAQFRVVGFADTYLVWWPHRSPSLRIAWVWPLVEPSHRAVGDEFYDDDLAASVAGGRLDTLLRLGAARHLPLTWAVDPELLDALHRMTVAYTVRGERGASGAAAKAWLDRARTVLKNAGVLPLPYADPDLGATAAGALAPDTARAAQLAKDVLRRDLGLAGDPRLAWPPGTVLDPAVESLLSGQGVKGVVVPYSALPLAEQLPYTPTAPTPLAANALGSMTAIVAEPQLSGWVAADPAQDGPRLAAQRFVADTAMTALERPGDLRDVVVTPPRTWDPVGDFAAQLLQQTDEAPWLVPVSVETVLGDEPSGAARTRAAEGPDVLPADQVRRVLDERRGLARVRGILTDPKRAPAELAELDDALLRSVSASWGADPGGGHRLVSTVDAAVYRQVGRLRLVSGSLITMTGRSGRIPLTFVNDLGQEVRVRVRLDSRHRLTLSQPGYESARGQEVTVPPGTSTRVVRGKAVTGGLFPIKVEVLAPDGSPLAIRTTLKVRSTAYGAVALAITGVAFGLLLVASATRLLQRRRRTPPAPAPEPVPVG
jgi:hypothetical protein